MELWKRRWWWRGRGGWGGGRGGAQTSGKGGGVLLTSHTVEPGNSYGPTWLLWNANVKTPEPHEYVSFAETAPRDVDVTDVAGDTRKHVIPAEFSWLNVTIGHMRWVSAVADQVDTLFEQAVGRTGVLAGVEEQSKLSEELDQVVGIKQGCLCSA